MFLHYFTIQDKLDTLLRDGLPINRKSPQSNRTPECISLTAQPEPIFSSSKDITLVTNFDRVQGGLVRNHTWSMPESFPFEGAVRVHVRIRREQVKRCHFWFIENLSPAQKIEVSKTAGGLGAVDDWFVVKERITPNQITRADEWSAFSGKWVRIKLNRRLQRPAAGQLASLHYRQPSFHAQGTPSASTMVGLS